MSEPTNTLEDTFSLKGFVSIGAFADNDLYETAPLGELSLQSATYSKDRSYYSTTSTGANPTTLELAVFSCRTLTNPLYTTPVEYQSKLLEIIRWCHARAIDNTFNHTSETCRQAIVAEFGSFVSDVVVGQMISQDSVWLPASLTFYFIPSAFNATWTDEQQADLERSRIKLWFADQAFAGEYDECAMEFLAPIDNARLDDFFLIADQVAKKVAQRTMEETMLMVHQLKGNKPETKIRTINFLYHDPANRDRKIPTNWTFVIYGIAGDNIDKIKELLTKWVLENSTHTREEWAAIFPDLFTSTEFIITPMWSQYAVPNETLQDGVYSPTVNVLNALSVARRSCTGTAYTQNHIDSVLTVVGCPYKSIGLLIVGGPENRNGLDRFEEVWPDYMSVFTSSLDYNRMQPETQQWVSMLHAMLKAAETMTDFSDLPQTPFPMTRLKRTNANDETFMYVVCNYGNIQYLVVSRQSMQQYFPPRGVDALRITSEGAEGVNAMPNADITAGAYSTTFVAVGGKGPYVFDLISVSDNTKLENVAIDPDTGEFTASPLAAGDILVTVRVTDDNTTSATKSFTLHIYSKPSDNET